MKKLIRRFIKWLYVKFGEPDLVALTREQLLGTGQEVDLSFIKEDEWLFISAEAKTILNNDVFKMAANNVKARVLKHIQYEAQSTEVIFYDRFSINGVCLLEDELKSYLNPLEEDGEEFDKNSMV